MDNSTWESKTLSNTLEFRHANSSPTSIVNALNQLTKGAELMAHSLVLVRN
ncbi:uncharacterized protein M421DRAFT_407701 [Didymella exigua CBS 183.55]|uniref:Uncharacterized protein n=1 Tax=Didymella exigua CBS 183.55 TaxID=1150837 RepID=A0A6A5R6H3_9PLEO|nr:uncharacterized protein M421DRAFT_407701 [Didymella exigua CBS 183.55]KAF1922989.1 hypothetical protein M421DRAFT_407701 [Didymella exigua CBS 183.55]